MTAHFLNLNRGNPRIVAVEGRLVPLAWDVGGTGVSSQEDKNVLQKLRYHFRAGD